LTRVFTLILILSVDYFFCSGSVSDIKMRRQSGIGPVYSFGRRVLAAFLDPLPSLEEIGSLREVSRLSASPVIHSRSFQLDALPSYRRELQDVISSLFCLFFLGRFL